MIIRPSLLSPSHGPSVSASSRVHTCARPAARYLPTLLFARRTLILFTLSPSPAPALPLRDPCTLGSWKCCLDAPRRPAGSRGKNATLLIIKYARDAVWEGRTGGRGPVRYTRMYSVVWKYLADPERSTKEFRPQEIPENFSEGCSEKFRRNFWYILLVHYAKRNVNIITQWALNDRIWIQDRWFKIIK